MNKKLNLQQVRKILIEDWCKRSGADFKEQLKDRDMLVHKNHSMNVYGSLGYLFFALKGSPPKGYGVFSLGVASNGLEVTGSLNINGQKTIKDLTIIDLDLIEDDDIIKGDSSND